MVTTEPEVPASPLQGPGGLNLRFDSNVDNGNTYAGDLGFDLPFFNTTISRFDCYVGSNSYITFGFASNASSGISASNPGPALLIDAGDRSYQRMYGGSESAGSYRIRFEGGVSAFETPGSPSLLWEVTLFNNGFIQVLIGDLAGDGVSMLTDGTGSNFIPFVPTKNSSFVFEKTGSAYTLRTGTYSL